MLDKRYRKWHPNYDCQKAPGETSWEFYQRAITPMAIDTNLRLRSAIADMPFSKQEGIFKALRSDEGQVMGAIAECLVFGAVSRVADRIEVIPETTEPTPDFRAHVRGIPFDLEVTTFVEPPDYEYKLHYELDCAACDLGLRNVAASIEVKPTLREAVSLPEVYRVVHHVQRAQHSLSADKYWDSPLKIPLEQGVVLNLRLIKTSDEWRGLYGMGGGSFVSHFDLQAELRKALDIKAHKKKPQVSGHNSILVVWDRSELGSRMGLTGDSYHEIRRVVWPRPTSRPNLVEVWMVNTLWEHMTRKAQVDIIPKWNACSSQWSASDLAEGFRALTSDRDMARWGA